jgi:SprA-related family
MIDALTTSALFLGNARSDAADRFARQPGTVPTERPVGNAPPAGPSNANGPSLTAAPVPPLDISSQTTAQEQEPEDGKQQTSDQAPEQAPGQESPLTGKKDGEGPDGLTEAERKEVQKLKQRDREVRAHEAAHKAAGGSIAGAPSFETTTGPDGRSYAVAGEVSIDTSPIPNNPEATIRKLEIVKRAALAPSQPSAQDRQVAADAAAKIQQARIEKREQDAEEREKVEGSDEPKPNETKPNETQVGETPPSEAQPRETRGDETKLGETKPADGDRTPLSAAENASAPATEDRDDRPSGNIQPTVTIDPGTLLNLVA